MTSLRVLAARGELRKAMAAEAKAVKNAPARTVKRETRRLQLAARDEVNRNLGQRRKIGGAIRSRTFADPDGAAGLVYSKFGRGHGRDFADFLVPFTKGAELRPRQSKFLYIPLERGVRARRRRRQSVALSKNLRFIPSRDGRKFFLVRETRTRTTLLAVLIRRVKIPKKLDFERLARNLDRVAAEGLVETLEEEAV